MALPIASIVNLTATGDVIIGPGGFTHLQLGLPSACMGDAVAGPVVVSGVITMATPIHELLLGRPSANVTAVVSGISLLGVPVVTPVMVSPHIHFLIL
jgi:hypothetical protein